MLIWSTPSGFKVVGLILVAGVIISMVIRPVFKEILEYMKILNKQGITVRALVSLSLVTCLIVLFLIPLPRKVTAPALLTAQEAAKVFAPSAAEISEVHVVEGQIVTEGDHLISLSNPSLLYEKAMLQEQIDMMERRLISESDWTGSSTLQEIQKENIESKKAELNQVVGKIRDLVLTSPVNGEVVMIEDWVRAGSAVSENMVLAEVATTSKPVIRAYVTALDKKHVSFGEAVFINESDSQSQHAELISVSTHAIASLEDEVLAIPNGGSIAVTTIHVEQVKPKNDLYLAVLDPIDTQSMIRHEQSGVVMFPAKARSMASSTMQRIYGVVIRESGF